MQATTLSAMFMLGLLGTGHCVGMCGPLVVAFPARTGRWGPQAAYHLGRIATYACIGALMGGAGRLLAAAAPGGGPSLGALARIQVLFSLVAAVFLTILGLCRLGLLREPDWFALASPQRIPGFSRLLKSPTAPGSAVDMFLAGLALGLLPCGLSFAAFARALPAGGAAEGGLLVLAFGLGTVPGLLLLGTGAAGIARRYRAQSDLLAGVLMSGMAAYLAAKAFGVLAG
ncbi:MAG: sulfite exporter TauE/SafE family protein [Desulfobacterales bacterium]|nr:sulfite exporter TauE/SafE family protein [Desulfobacterales bacterium]